MESVIVFAGQGVLQRWMFRSGALRQRYFQVLEEAGAADSIEEFVLAASVAHFADLDAHGARPAAIVGHGFGELVGLVCAGAFTVSQGAEIARQRAAVLNECQSEPGGMLSAVMTRATADRLVTLAGASRTAIAAENAPTDIVIAGTRPGLAAVWQRTCAEGITATPLKARGALHCRQMLPAAVELTKRLRGVPSRPLRLPVFSPTLGRYYRPSDDLAECFARQLILRVRFADAIRSLVADGARGFVECGPLRGLARSVGEIAAARSDDEFAPDDQQMSADPTGGPFAGAGDEEPVAAAEIS